MPSTTLDEFRLPVPIAFAQRMGAWADSAGLKLVNSDPAALIAAAERQTGLHDWGDPAFLRDYRVLMTQIAAASDQLTFLGKSSLRTDLLRILTIRLRMNAIFAQRPALSDDPIQRPLFIVGLPRTGTTLLHKLFACDPARRVAEYWEFLAPYPPDVPPSIPQRIRSTESLARLANSALPGMSAIHLVDAHAPEECVFLMPHHLVMHMRAFIPAYADWLFERDLRPDYAYHKQQLQALSVGHEGKGWVLKAPFHLFSLPELFAVYPDAGIIHTHRDPKKVIGSWCSFAGVIAKFHRKHPNVSEIAADWLHRWHVGIQRAVAFRDQHPTANVIDLHYHDLIADPIAAMRRLYLHFGAELFADAETQMRAALEADKHDPSAPTHRYDLAQLGMTAEQIDSTFHFYTERFNVRLES